MSALAGRLRDSFLKTLRGSSFVRSVAVLAGGTALGQGLIVLASPLLTRLYTPLDFGVLAAYTSILSILLVVASLRYELAITLPEDDESAGSLLVLSLAIVLGMTALVGLTAWLLGGHIARWTNASALQPYLWLLPISFLGAGVYQVLNYWAVRKRAFGRIAQTQLSQGLGMVLTQVGSGLLELGPAGLLLGDVVGRVSGAGTLMTLSFRKDGSLFKRVSIPRIRWAALRYRRFPLLSSVSVLINSAGLQLPPLLMAAFYGPQAAGLFALGQRVIGMPMALVGRAVAQVYMGEASRLAQEDPGALHRLFFGTARRLLSVCIVPIVALGASGPRVFTLLFGERWPEAGVYVRLLAIMFVAQFVVVPLSQTLNVLERQDWQLAWDVGRLVMMVGGLWIASALGWPARIAVMVYGVAMFIAYGGLFVLSGVAVRQRFRGASGQEPEA
jgi:O-antigen/teichoic acid export membrane protein